MLIALMPLMAQALDINGTSYLSLRQLASKLGMQANQLEKGKTVELKSKWTRMTFEVHKREIEINGYRVFLGFPVAESGQQLFISESDFTHQIRPILTPQLNGTPPELRHIVLDPGHGGKDPGAQNPDLGLHEKALTLDLAVRVKRELVARGFKVSLTRQSDDFHSLESRPAQANSMGADLFISLHFNASANDKVAGVETYVLTPPYQPSSARASLHSTDRQTYPGNEDGPWSTLAAYYVQRSLAATLGTTDRGLKRARFTVLRDLHIPGMLIEGGFVTNDKEGRNVGSAAYRDKIARSVADGIVVYQRSLQRFSGKPQ